MAWLGQAFQHEADQASIAADPGERPLDDPSLWQHNEAVEIGALDDLDLPASGPGCDVRHFRPLISGVGEDPLDEWKTPPRLAQQAACAVPVLNVGRQNAHAEEQAERVDKNVALAPADLLARVIALRIERGAPF